MEAFISPKDKLQKEALKIQKDFILEHKITEDELFDASLIYNLNDIKDIMFERQKIFAFNYYKSCSKGHNLISRAGHCIQCRTANIEFIRRYVSSGFIYIAGSIKAKMIKVGFTKGIENRSISLNKTKYGGFSDWELLCSVDCEQGGIVERKIHGDLYQNSVVKTYQHDGKSQKANELFHCSYDKALNSLKKYISINPSFFKIIRENKSKISNYQFRNLSKDNIIQSSNGVVYKLHINH